jgi:hypothetical protein
MTTTPLALVDALQTTLEAEHAAVYLYGVLGARTSASAQPQLYADVSAGYAAHRARRDRLRTVLADAGEVPVAAEPAYELPGPLGSTAQVTRAAREIERSCATTYAWLVANAVGDQRRWAVTALTDAAVRELTFRGSPEIFPGAGEYADR